MKLLIAGSRGFTDYQKLKKNVLRFVKELGWDDVEVISGCAKGADKLGEELADEMWWPVIPRPAQWDLYGMAAGPIRNSEMVKECDAAIIFWDGKSPGTADTVKKIMKTRKPFEVL